MSSACAPIIHCHHCAGTGKVRLPKHLLVTLSWLKLNGASDAATVYKGLKEDVGHTAVNNRLVVLCTLGLARREKREGLWFYEAIHTGIQEPARHTESA